MRALAYTAGIAGVLAALALVTIDQPVARWIATRELYPHVWNTIIGYLEYTIAIEPFRWGGIYIVVAGALLTLFVAPLRKHAHFWSILALTHLLAQNIMIWLKPLFARYRPTQWIKHGTPDATFFHYKQDAFSFPSGHVLLFASVVLPIVLAYPKARPLLVVVLFAMCARVAVNAHFVGDVLGGLAFTAAATWVCAAGVRRALPSQIRPPYLQ